MSESLPDRLRQRARFARNLGHPHAPLDEEAADELDRLTAENKALRELVRMATTGFSPALTKAADGSDCWWLKDVVKVYVAPEQAALIRSCVEGGDDE